MKFEQYEYKLELLKKLILHGNTGSPAELANKLGVSERTIRRCVERLKKTNPSIVFCRKSNSYLEK